MTACPKFSRFPLRSLFLWLFDRFPESYNKELNSPEVILLRCQRCPKPATMHITEIFSEEKIEELHMCEDCAQRFLADGKKVKKPKSKGHPEPDSVFTGGGGPREKSQACPHCGTTFAEYRSTGRLGCPIDYDTFHEDLVALLENVHGETRHNGKVPLNLARHRQHQDELSRLGKELQGAITRENYEEAAKFRDLIKTLESK